MKGKYQAAFLVPAETLKFLGEDGWEFESENNVPENIKDFLTDVLALEFLKVDLGIAYYVNDIIQASLFYDEDEENIEHVYFQIYNDKIEVLKSAFLVSEFYGSLDLFVPNE
ncbi:MAG: hypothetical protein COB30_001700 [Ectothiorhodospiraceae bacterium]|nr:hypothetical protein [Ectothiorhodospiraceae bacterium]